MKTIKFRGINDDGSIVYPDNSKRLFGGLKSYDILQRFSNVEQFTGLQDSKGKNIYEGDLVKSFNNDVYCEREFIEEVKYEGGAFYPICEEPSENFEVIGNIHEDKNLLT